MYLHTELPLAHGSDPPCNEGDIRLVDGRNEFHGRVEMCQEREWKTICDSGWGVEEAKVVCRQLGYMNVVNGLLILILGISSDIKFHLARCCASPAGNKILYRSRLYKNHQKKLAMQRNRTNSAHVFHETA